MHVLLTRLPRQRVRLEVGETFHRFLYALLVPESRIFDPAKGGQFEAETRHFTDVDGADIQPRDTTGDHIEPVGAYRRRQSVSGRIGDLDGFIERTAPGDRLHR